MASLSQLIVKITGDASDFTRAISAAQRQAQGMAEKFEAAGSVLTRSLTLPLGALGGFALKQAADFEQLRRGMESVTGSTEKASAQFERLKKVAELPGLGFKEAVQGSINLQAAGFSAQFAERGLKAFGNALVTIGRGKEDLDGVIRALSQIQGKGVFQAEELNQLAERLPQVRKLIQDAFGTANTEVIQKLGLTTEQIIEKIITEFEKLPQVTGGLRNAFENLRDRSEQSLAAIGNALAPFALAAIRAIDPVILKLGELGTAFGKLDPTIQTAVVGLAGVAVATGPVLKLVAAIKELEIVALAATARVGIASGLAGAIKTLGEITLIGNKALELMFLRLTLIGGGAAIIYSLADSFGFLKEGANTAADGIKRLNERFDAKKLATNSKEIGDATRSAFSGISDLADRVFVDLKKSSEDAGKSIATAFSTLGIKSSADLRKELQAAQAALEQIRQAIKTGGADQNDYAAGLEKVRAIQEQLSGKLKETALNLNSIDFAAKSKDNELFAASIARIGRESDELRNQIITLRAVGEAFQGFGEGPALEGSLDAFARLVEGANKYNAALIPIEERNLRFVESLEKLSTAGAIAGESLQNIKIPGVLNDIQEDIVKRTSAPFRTEKLTAFQRQVSTILTDFSRGAAEAIVQGESLGQVFTKIGQQIQTALIRNAIEQGLKVLGKELGKLIAQLGDVGRAIAGAFGGVAQSAGNVAGAASGAAGSAGSVAGSAAGIAAGGLAGTITAVSGIATAVFSALQFFQGRRMEQDIGRIEVSNREIASQTIAIQERLDQWLPYLNNTALLQSIDGNIRMIYEGLAQMDFSGLSGGKLQNVTFNITKSDPKAVMREISRELGLQSKAFQT